MRRGSSRSVRVFYPRFSRESLVEAIERSLPKLMERLHVTLVALLGSYAKQRHTAASDVDLLVVYENPARSDAYKIIIDSLRIPKLEPLVYSQEQFEQLAKADSNLVRLMLRDGIAIYGRLPEY